MTTNYLTNRNHLWYTVFALYYLFEGGNDVKQFTTQEVAERLGVTPRAIHKWIKRGRFPNAYKLDPDSRTSPYRIPEDDVVAFEERRHATQ